MAPEELVAQARENWPDELPPSLAAVDCGLWKLLRTLLSGFDYEAMVRSGPGVICRALAALFAEVEALERRR